MLRIFLLILFFASGTAALIYELVWFHLVTLVVGASSLSIAALLASFMGGMAIGSALLPRLVPATAHPLRVESVAWVTERKDVLSGLFFLLALVAYARYAGAPSRGRAAVVAALLALGTMAKPMVVTLPAVLLLLDYWPLGRLRTPRDLPGLEAEKVPLLAVSAASAAVTYQASHSTPRSSSIASWRRLIAWTVAASGRRTRIA